MALLANIPIASTIAVLRYDIEKNSSQCRRGNQFFKILFAEVAEPQRRIVGTCNYLMVSSAILIM